MTRFMTARLRPPLTAQRAWGSVAPAWAPRGWPFCGSSHAAGRPPSALSVALALALLLTLAGCGQADPPVPSSSPTRLLRVAGELDATLELRVFTQHFTAAKKCRRAENLFRRLDGRAQPRSAWVESDVERTDGHYTATIALDHFEPGDCGWHPFVIGFQVATRDGLSTGTFATGPDGQGRLAPAPENKVWIDSAAGAASRPDDRPAGHARIAPMELMCRKIEMRGVAALTCLPDIPRGLALISEQATEVQVDFRDRTGGAAH